MGIVGEIVEFQVSFFVELDELPVFFADRSVGHGPVVVRVVPVEGVALEFIFPIEEREEAHAVTVLIGAGGEASGFEHGRVEVGADDHFGTGGFWRDFGGPLHDEGFADAAFVREAFEAFESGGGGVVVSAVVSGEDDHGVLGDAKFIEFGDEATDTVVEGFDHAGATWFEMFVFCIVEGFGFLGVFFNQSGGCHHRAVDSVVGEVEEEGVVLFLFEKIDGGIGELVGEEVAWFALVEAGHAEGREVFPLSFRLAPLAATDVDVESVTGGVVLIEVGLADGHEVPFAKEGGGVAGLLEGFGKEDTFVLDARFPLGNGELGEGFFVAGNPVGEFQAGGVASTEDGRAAGRAHGAGGVSIGEEHTVRSELVDVRGFVKLRAVTSEVAQAEVIDEEEDEVGLGVFGGKKSCEGEAEESEGQRENFFHETLENYCVG